MCLSFVSLTPHQHACPSHGGSKVQERGEEGRGHDVWPGVGAKTGGSQHHPSPLDPSSPRFYVQHPHRMSFPFHYRTTHRHIWVGLL
jgi:hypothetical protein